MADQNNIEEAILIRKVLSLIAVGITDSQETFSGWLLAGFGVALTLIVSNIEAVSKFLKPEDIKSGVLLYLVALAAGILQRWLASGIKAGAAMSKEAEELGRNSSSSVNPENILNEIENVIFYPQKWFVRYQFNKLRNGDHAASGKMQILLAQCQSILAVLQGLLVISSIAILVQGLNA